LDPPRGGGVFDAQLQRKGGTASSPVRKSKRRDRRGGG
jgi:hypothetical protein